MASTSAAPVSTESRHELIRSAVAFLKDPTVSASPLAQKITFLSGKGLTDAEVQQALAQAASDAASGQTAASPATAAAEGSSAAQLPAWQQQQQQPQQAPYPAYGQPAYAPRQTMVRPMTPPRRDWRDYFVMAVISGGVMYGLSALVKRYLLPHILPPPAPLFTQTSTNLATQTTQIQTTLDDLITSTAELRDSLAAERERVRALCEEVERVLEGVRKREDEEREWREEVAGEVEGLKEGLPKMLESHTNLLKSSLTALQSEMTSLKPLLNPRMPSVASPSPTPAAGDIKSRYAFAGSNGGSTPQIPSWQLAAMNGAAKAPAAKEEAEPMQDA